MNAIYQKLLTVDEILLKKSKIKKEKLNEKYFYWTRFSYSLVY